MSNAKSDAISISYIYCCLISLKLRVRITLSWFEKSSTKYFDSIRKHNFVSYPKTILTITNSIIRVNTCEVQYSEESLQETVK
jgi:hypothetical protein